MGCIAVLVRVERALLATLLVCATCVVDGCAGGPKSAPLNEIYGEAAQNIGAERNPVVVIPGILGSKLVDGESGRIVWGAFTYGAADADFPDGARLVALPMREGEPLSALRDGVEPDGVLDSLEVNVALLRVTALEPYKGIIEALAAGRYVDRDITQTLAGVPIDRTATRASGPVDYAGLHYTCFQFDYDWRRDISENAARLDQLIRDASEAAGAARGTGEPVKVDVVAHSMGGMVLLYYLRYGTQALPEDGSLPAHTWAGAEHVNKAIIVGTPSAGSVLSLKQLIEGVTYSALAPKYRPAVLGTMPAIYQLMPRERHNRVVDAATGEPISGLYDAKTWERLGWGIVNPNQDKYLAWLMPEVSDKAERRRLAAEHLQKCLSRTEQLHRALDVPMEGTNAPPSGLSISLVLGDAERTPSVLEVDSRSGIVRVRESAPGDGTVTRASALMDEREGSGYTPRLRSPIAWSNVTFIAADHIELTRHPAFIDSMLYQMLEEPNR